MLEARVTGANQVLHSCCSQGAWLAFDSGMLNAGAAALGRVWLSHLTPGVAFLTFAAPTTAFRPCGKVAGL
jgi:hypothetical protein